MGSLTCDLTPDIRSVTLQGICHTEETYEAYDNIPLSSALRHSPYSELGVCLCRQADHALLGEALGSPSPLLLPGARLSEVSPAVAAAAGDPEAVEPGLLVVPACWSDLPQPSVLVCLAGRPTGFSMEDALLVRHVFG